MTRSNVAAFLSATAVFLSSAADVFADEVTFWNNELLQAVRATNTAPPVASRSMAMMHVAVFDAVNSVSHAYEPYHRAYSATPSALPEAAVAQASRDVLVDLFPSLKSHLDAQLAARLAQFAPGPERDAGVSLGVASAAGILALRADDGSDAVVPYVPGADPGQWRPTPPAQAPSLLPNWPQVTPWTMDSGSQFRASAGPPGLDSQAYAEALAEVRSVGAVDAEATGNRSAEQTQIAQFWADGAGTSTPPGHWNLIAQDIVAEQGATLLDSARTFALLNLALADAAIVSWDSKYAYECWRPVTAIREGEIDPDPIWTPLLTTPPFPSYTSGHSTFSAAAAAVLGDLFGDDTAFQSTGEGIGAFERHFDSLSEAAAEAGMSRIYGGIHFQFDNEVGLTTGDALGRHVAHNQLRPVPEPGSTALLVFGTPALTVLCRRRRHFKSRT
jgi:membrane-associated phospholipid phosphatase